MCRGGESCGCYLVVVRDTRGRRVLRAECHIAGQIRVLVQYELESAGESAFLGRDVSAIRLDRVKLLVGQNDLVEDLGEITEVIVEVQLLSGLTLGPRHA